MPSDTPDDSRSVAIEQLKALGLSAYAARTFVALARFGEGTAQDVADVSDVPRTRVYDAVDELADRGLVDVQHSTPKRFWAVSTETAGQHFGQEYSYRVNRLTEALETLESSPRTVEQRGVWTVTGRETVTERVAELVATADDEVVYMTVEDLLDDDVSAALRAASERGVTIRLGGMSDSTEGVLAAAVPDADGFDSLWDWSATPAGRLLMVDERKTLASVLVPGDDRESDARDETAIWGEGETNSLVVVLKSMFAWQLDGNRE